MFIVNFKNFLGSNTFQKIISNLPVLRKQKDNLEEIFAWVKEYREKQEPLSIAYYGNMVELWQYVYDNKINVELASDQTSCHAVYEGGYSPQGMSFEEARQLMRTNFAQFKKEVDKSLQKQFELIQKMANRGTFFWDYGNSFMKAVFDAGATTIAKGDDPINGFIFPSYVEDIMGPLNFDLGSIW